MGVGIALCVGCMVGTLVNVGTGKLVDVATGAAVVNTAVGCVLGAQAVPRMERLNKIQYALRNAAMRMALCRNWAGLDFKLNLAGIGIGLIWVEQTRVQAEFATLLFTTHVHGKHVFALHGFYDAG